MNILGNIDGDGILLKARGLLPQLISWRREFHIQPELGFHEENTAKIISGELTQLGFIIKRNVGTNGIVADFGNDRPRFAIRADMDALPIQEVSSHAYISRNPGVMHACGHDAHMACALGAAYLLSKENIPGSIRFIFQPAEEIADENGLSGAQHMVNEGAMDGVDAIIALHVDAATPSGYIRIEEGPASGGVDSWFGVIIGKGGHGAYPHETIDPFFLTVQVINAINSIVSRRIHPFSPAVISIGSLNGGTTENVIPDSVTITGTLRYTEEKVQKQIHAELKRAFEIASVLGGDYNLHLEIGSPPMMNDSKTSELLKSIAIEILGEDKVLPLKKELGAEDFGCFLDLVPGAMFSLGAKLDNFPVPLHNPSFDIDESCLPIGAAILYETARRYLSQKSK